MTTLTLDVIARDRASKTLAGIGTSTDKTAGRFDHFKTRAVIAGAVAGAAIVKFAGDSIKAYTDAETQQAKLEQAFKKFPGLADSNIGAFRKLNTQLATKTKFDDDATASGQATLAQFKLTGGQITQLTPLLQDYAAKTGKDLPTAAQDLGKAMLGQGRALKGVGINFKDTGTASGNFQELMGGLNAKVGGFAQNEGKTAAGQAAILKNQFGEVEETVGSKLVPVLVKLAGWLLAVIAFTQKYSGVIVPVVAVLGALAGIIWTILTVTKVWTAVQAAFNIVMAMNPIGLVIIGVALLVAGLIIAYKKSETFRNIVNGAFKAVGTAVSFMWNNVIKPVFKLWINAWFTVIGAILNGAATAFGWVPGIGGKLKAAAKKFNDFRDSVNRSLDGIKDKQVNVRVKVSSNVPGSLGLAKLDGRRAAGGPVRAGGAYLVGENGPEIFNPDRSGQVVPNNGTKTGVSGGNGGGGDINIYVSGAIDPVGTAKAVEQVLVKLKRANGGRPLAFQ